MKFINGKRSTNEPQDFKEYRETTPNAAYGGGNFSIPNLLDALLKEQGYICAYCMGKLISQEDAHVEHFLPRQTNKHEELNYMNLLAVCNGLTESHPEKEHFHHCDKTKGIDGKMNGKVSLKVLDPREKKKSEDRLTYTLNGLIMVRDKSDTDVLHDLEKVLNLNNKGLVQRRKALFDAVKDKLKQDMPQSTWTQAFFAYQRTVWLSRHDRKGKQAFRAYCMTAVWFLDQLSQQPKYQ